VVGFFGQNFDNLPGAPGWHSSRTLMYAMVASCVALPLSMGWFFRRKHWF
jgi:Mg2+ and Co2+ transporter CorA